MGDYAAASPWNDSSVKGCKRFLERVAVMADMIDDSEPSAELESKFHKAIKKVSSDIEETKFNTAIATLMALVNDVYQAGKLTRDEMIIFIKLLNPFAPHLCEEIYEAMGGEGFLSQQAWPAYDEEKTKDAVIEIGVQVNGKLRGTVKIAAEATKEEALQTAKGDAKVAEFLSQGSIVKEIYVPGKIVNFVVK